MSRVHKLNGKDYLALGDNCLHYFEITGSTREAKENGKPKQSFSDWGDAPIDIPGFKVVPFGSDNDIPRQIQESVFPNSLAPRLQNRKIELLFEQGPYLYKEVKDGKKLTREPQEDNNINDWLIENDYEEILMCGATDYYYTNQVYNKMIRDRQGRLSGGSISEIKALSSFDARLAYRINDKREIPTHVVVGDWGQANTSEFEVYPLYDRANPTKYPVSIFHSKYKSFGLKEYALPEIYGSLEWINRSTSVPKIFKALTDNSLNIKWHIQSPAKYWDDKRTQLKKNCDSSQPPKEYKEQMLEDLKKEILDKLAELLSGEDNVGKFWHNEYVVELIGANAMEHGWKITPIEQKISEYVKAQIEISNKADFATVAGLGLHAALGNVGADGKSDSGSEQLYALKIHQLTSVNIAEYYVCRAINEAIRARFKTDIKIGFYHINPEREMDVASSNRVTNQLNNAQ